ncbi:MULTISPECIES: hypothetical protein [unclassified Streptomyces]
MRQEWEPEDLIEVWTLLEDDQERLRNKSGANRFSRAPHCARCTGWAVGS